LVAENGYGLTRGGVVTFTTEPSVPLITALYVTDIHSDGATFHLGINAGGGATTFHFEYGHESCTTSPEACESAPDRDAGSGTTGQEFEEAVTSLESGSVYYVRVSAENVTGSSVSTEKTFTTFPFGGVLTDTCPNAHVRQQTGAAMLADCRAY